MFFNTLFLVAIYNGTGTCCSCKRNSRIGWRAEIAPKGPKSLLCQRGLNPKSTTPYQGCQMAYFHTKNANVGVLRNAIGCRYLVYFMAVWYFLPSWYILLKYLWYFCVHFGMFSPFWCVLPGLIWQPRTIPVFVSFTGSNYGNLVF
jgi:hypothetical protein